jgi:hypothetical protein
LRFFYLVDICRNTFEKCANYERKGGKIREISSLYFVSPGFRDEILEHQLYKRLESFAPCYSQSLVADFKILGKKFAKHENASLFINSILRNRKMRVENQAIS